MKTNWLSIQVYRHLLFNRLGRDDNRFDVSALQFSITGPAS